MFFATVGLNQPVIVGPESVMVVERRHPHFFTVEHRGKRYAISAGQDVRIDLPDGWLVLGTSPRRKYCGGGQVRLGIDAPQEWRIQRPR